MYQCRVPQASTRGNDAQASSTKRLAMAFATLTVPVVNFHMRMQSEHPAS